jgi:hypothetical protein
MWEVDDSQAPVTVDRLRVTEIPASEDVARLVDVPAGADACVLRYEFDA